MIGRAALWAIWIQRCALAACKLQVCTNLLTTKETGRALWADETDERLIIPHTHDASDIAGAILIMAGRGTSL
jgi:hypothetical protein